MDTYDDRDREALAPAASVDADRKAMLEEAGSADRHGRIALAAYLMAERRGFVGGDPVQDWLAAEADFDTLHRTVLR